MQPILKIDLSTGSTENIIIPVSWEQDYLGGASLAARMLFEHLVPELDPLSPEAPLLFMNGPLTGTAGPAVGRFVITARSPATGLWGESNCGGFWGPELRMAGYDGLWIQGRAEQPVYIWICDNHIEIRSAIHLWGSDTYVTQRAVESELGSGRARIAVIGPAGEAMLPFSLILTDHGRVAGRTGMGAVMGAKNLKAIAVKGSRQIPVVDPEAFKLIRSSANRELRSDAVSKVLQDLGSGGAAEYFDYLGMMPKRYYRSAESTDILKTSGASLSETILAGVSACHACVIACGRVVRLEDGAKRKGPEYETIVGFGPNLWLDDLKEITRLGELCDQYGMDSISLSNTIGLAFKLYEMSIIDDGDTEGITLNWGDAKAVERLIHLTVAKRGFGELLAKGAKVLANTFGVEKEAVQVNGLEVAYHDPRGASGMALVYATSPRGACHNQSDYYMVEIGDADPKIGLAMYPRHAGVEKVVNVIRHQDYRTVWNSLVLCIFANVPPDTIITLINTACGLEWDIAEMLIAGERAWNLKRAINNRLGLRSSWDKLPEPLMRPYPPSSADNPGQIPPFQAMLDAYYDARGWDSESGFPSQDKLNDLGLSWVIDHLKK